MSIRIVSQVWQVVVHEQGEHIGCAFVEPVNNATKSDAEYSALCTWCVDLCKCMVFKDAESELYVRVPEQGIKSLRDLHNCHKTHPVRIADRWGVLSEIEVTATIFEYPMCGAFMWWHVPSVWEGLELKLSPGIACEQ